MGMFDSFDINATGMTAQRFRMDIISQNVANANTTRTSDGTPYVRKVVTFTEKDTQTPFHHVLNKATDRYSGKGVKIDGVYATGNFSASMDVTYFRSRQYELEAWGEPFQSMYRAYESTGIKYQTLPPVHQGR